MHADPVRLRQGIRAVGVPTAGASALGHRHGAGLDVQQPPVVAATLAPGTQRSRCHAPRTGGVRTVALRALADGWLVRGLTHVALERPGPHRVILTAGFGRLGHRDEPTARFKAPIAAPHLLQQTGYVLGRLSPERPESPPWAFRRLLGGPHHMFTGRARKHDVRLTGIHDVYGSWIALHFANPGPDHHDVRTGLQPMQVRVPLMRIAGGGAGISGQHVAVSASDVTRIKASWHEYRETAGDVNIFAARCCGGIGRKVDCIPHEG